MSSFCGILLKSNLKNQKEIFNAIVSSFEIKKGDQLYQTYGGRFALYINGEKPVNHVKGDVDYFEDDNFVLFIDGEIETRTSSRNNKINNLIIDEVDDSPDLLRGSFSIVILKKQFGELKCLRDQFGTRPFYYVEHEDFLAFSSEIGFLLRIPGIIRTTCNRWIADSISLIKSEKFRSPYEKIFRLPPSTMLVYNNKIELIPYWDLKVDLAFSDLNFNEALEVYCQKLRMAITRRLINRNHIGSELSGGLDSSGITAFAYNYLKGQNKSLLAFTNAFHSNSIGLYYPSKDEREYSLKLSDFLGIENHIFCDSDGYDVINALKKTITIQSGPTILAFNIFSDTLYDRAKENGIELLLSGFGGDEGISSNARGYFEELRRKQQWTLLRKEYFQSSSFMKQNKMNTIIKFLLFRHIPIGLDFLKELLDNGDWRISKFENLAFSNEFGKEWNDKARYFRMVGFPNDQDVRIRQYKRIMHRMLPLRLEYSFHAAKARGIEYTYPFLDIDLLEFYYSLPSEFKFKNGMGRFLYRESMKGYIPETIRLRNNKTGATIPTIPERIIRDYTEIKGLIQRSKGLNHYHYLDYDKMLIWLNRIKHGIVRGGPPLNINAFINSLQILLLQEMERSGEHVSGIKH